MLGDRYRLDSVLGEGGMGVVYAGFDLTIERAVAIKLLHAGGTPEDASRLIREVRSMARVKSPHTVTLFDAGQADGGAPYLVMDLITGESLATVLEREHSIDPARAVAIALQVCKALSAAHAAGIVHRDVKPSNIMLSQGPPGETDKVTLLDFGIAKPTGPATALTQAGGIIGTLDYMAPEQIAGEAVDGRVDQYALAATVVRMISGECLFPGTNVASVLHHQLLKVPPSLRERVPTAPAPLDAALRRALEKKPGDRFATIDDFAAALRGDAVPDTVTSRTVPAAGVRDVPAATTPSAFGQPRELVLSEADDVRLEVDAPPEPEPRPPSAYAPLVRPAPVTVDLGAPLDPRTEALLPWLRPWFWKRVVLYAGLAMVLGNACARGFSTAWTVAAGLAVAAGVAALVLHAYLTRQRSL
jgi:serine/threonine-protein kinase